jgi:hypothetical protein
MPSMLGGGGSRAGAPVEGAGASGGSLDAARASAGGVTPASFMDSSSDRGRGSARGGSQGDQNVLRRKPMLDVGSLSSFGSEVFTGSIHRGVRGCSSNVLQPRT